MMLNIYATLWHLVVKLIEWDKCFAKYRYLAILTSPSISILITYIVFLTEMQKRQTLVKRFALFKNDITGSESTFRTQDTLQ